MKVITICGSLKFANEMVDAAYRLEFQGNCVITPIISNRKNSFTDDELEKLALAHECKIDLSDAIYVMDVGGYVGKSTQREIDYAKKQGKEVFYHEPTLDK